MTVRDEVWDVTLEQLAKTGKFRISDLPFDDSQQYTARRVLREMEEAGWLRRENKRAATWRIGPKGELHLNVSTHLLQQARA